MQNKSRAFTLIELLVVVLIIGILAAVALPQYEQAVLKSRFATIKNMTRSIWEAEKLYHLTNGVYSNRFSELSIDLPTPKETLNSGTSDGTGSEKYTYDKFWCRIFKESSAFQVNCGLEDEVVVLRYWTNLSNTYQRRECVVNNTNYDDKYNKLCKQETGAQARKFDTYTAYTYPSL